MLIVAHLSLDILDRILFALDPLDVASVSQASRFFREIIYGPFDRQFWRGLYLAQPLDDPRRAVTCLGSRREHIDWKLELQRITRARTVAQNPALCRRDERSQVLRTFIHLVSHVPPIASVPDGELSRNVRWVQRLLSDAGGASSSPSSFLEPEGWRPALSAEEEQLLARLHACYGLTRRDFEPARRQASQAFVYSQRHHTAQRAHGPFMPDGSMRVDWVFVLALVHDIRMLVVEVDAAPPEDEGERAYFCPLSMSFCQSIIPPGMNLDKEEDWAAVEGLWHVGYGFVDHREFILYNDPTVPEHEPQDTSIFEGTEETYASLDIYFRVTSTEPDPAHPTRPQINFVGEVDGRFNLVGFVKITDEDQVWWHFVGGNDNQMVWNCEAIGMSNVRSQRGVIGMWSTVFHDVEDPIGPFWMKRQLIVDEDE